MGKDCYERFSLVWCGRSIELSYQENWLNSGHWHMELRCTELLPVTATGYRSQFVVADAIAGAEAVEPYLLAWLDHAAKDPRWLKLLEASRQLKLF